jgi:orotate phosphoribosyltransferase-like protein
LTETLADQIRILAKQGLAAPEIAKTLGCTRKHAAWVLWTDKNKVRRRKWESEYRRNQYNTSPAVRSRVLSTLKKTRSKNRREHSKSGS